MAVSELIEVTVIFHDKCTCSLTVIILSSVSTLLPSFLSHYFNGKEKLKRLLTGSPGSPGIPFLPWKKKRLKYKQHLRKIELPSKGKKAQCRSNNKYNNKYISNLSYWGLPYTPRIHYILVALEALERPQHPTSAKITKRKISPLGSKMFTCWYIRGIKQKSP